MTYTGKTNIGIYIDVANIQSNGGYGMKFDVLREFACHDAGQPVRLNAYVTYDKERADRDEKYRQSTAKFFATLRDFGYKVIIKYFKWYRDDEGGRYAKANADLDMAVDALLQSENLERVLLATGDGDFLQVVRALQNKGCRVEVLAFNNISAELRREADVFINGYLIPNLVPTKTELENFWGEPGSRARGTCYFFNQEKGYGFIRYLKRIDGNLWMTDTRREDSPYEAIFFHIDEVQTNITSDQLPSYDMIFEFDIIETEKNKNFQARRIEIVYPRG